MHDLDVRLGIDLGTTRTLVALSDRGNFPIVGFHDDAGDLVEHYPSVTACVNGALVHGFEALTAERAGAPSLRSWKRLLFPMRQDQTLTVGEVEVSPTDLVASFLSAMKRDLVTRSTLHNAESESFEAVVSVPANAHSTQRFVTLDGFRRAGFDVKAVINEPSAAGVEYAHRHASTFSSRRAHVVVYDLGGGTFDAASVLIAEGRHDIAHTRGIAQLGGDDFDAQLLAMALERANIPFPTDAQRRVDLLLECRAAKEGIFPTTRKIVLDLAALGEDAPPAPITLPVADYYERVRPLVERTLSCMDPLIRDLREDEGNQDIAGIYMVGGATGLPIVPRIVRERFGRRVHRSPHPAGATAMGCAILAERFEEVDAFHVNERFTRHFGVFREAEAGARTVFDGIFSKGTPMPRGDENLVMTRRYQAVHSAGHYRFVEAAELDEGGDPCGDMTPHAEVRFAFEEGTPEPIVRLPNNGPWIEERYEVDARGVIAVTITNLDRAKQERFVL